MQSVFSGNDILAVQKFLNAIRAENFTIIESLKNSGLSMTVKAPAGGKEALHVACEAGVSAESVDRLIALGANVNATTDRGFTPLHVAAQLGRADLMIALIKAGANIEAVSDNGLGTTPLQEAAAAGQLQAVKILVASGVDASYRDRKYNLTALDLARINAGRIVVSVNEISAAILGAEKTFINQVTAKISEWQRDHVSQTQGENEYVARLSAIPFAELNGDQCFLKIQSALQEGYESVKKHLAPLRISMIKLMKQYNESKSSERSLKAIFADQSVPTMQNKEPAQEATTSIGNSIFSTIPSSSIFALPADIKSKPASMSPGGNDAK